MPVINDCIVLSDYLHLLGILPNLNNDLILYNVYACQKTFTEINTFCAENYMNMILIKLFLGGQS